MIRLVVEVSREKKFHECIFRTQWYRELARCIFETGEIDPFDVTLILVNEARIKELDAYYTRRPHVTDVLSFFYGDDGAYGEIFLCLPQAQRQALRHAIPLEREVARLFVHGTLHLAGYDHKRASQRQKMFALTNRILFVARKNTYV